MQSDWFKNRTNYNIFRGGGETSKGVVVSTDFMQIYQQRWKATNNIYANKTFSF